MGLQNMAKVPPYKPVHPPPPLSQATHVERGVRGAAAFEAYYAAQAEVCARVKDLAAGTPLEAPVNDYEASATAARWEVETTRALVRSSVQCVPSARS